MRFLVLTLTLSSLAFGDAIVKGKSSGYCSTQTLEKKDWIFEVQPIQVSPPQTCEDFSGEWEGQCYGAVLRCPKVGPLGHCIIPTADEIYLDNVQAVGQPTAHSITVKQEGCQTVDFGEIHLDVTSKTTGQAHLKFRRTCEVSGMAHAKWERTIDMALYVIGTRHWDGSRLYFSNDVRGADPNYQAQYRQMRNWRIYHPNGDPDQLRMDFGYFQDNRNYDPKAFEFYVPSYGGQVCVWRKK